MSLYNFLVIPPSLVVMVVELDAKIFPWWTGNESTASLALEHTGTRNTKTRIKSNSVADVVSISFGRSPF